MDLRLLVSETSSEFTCCWFARSLAAAGRTQMHRLRQLSFPNPSQAFQSQPSKRHGTSSARVAPFGLSVPISALANPETLAYVPKGHHGVLNWVSGHAGEHSWHSKMPLAPAIRDFEESKWNPFDSPEMRLPDGRSLRGIQPDMAFNFSSCRHNAAFVANSEAHIHFLIWP